MEKAERKERLINVLMKDGSPRRVGHKRAESLVDSGQARRYISNTIYRAMRLGIEVKDFGTQDLKGKLRKQINAAKAKTEKTEKTEKKPRGKTKG
jgi:hypothetical protein